MRLGVVFYYYVETYDRFDDYRSACPSHLSFPFILNGAEVLDDKARSRPELYALVFEFEAIGLPLAFKSMGQPVFIPQGQEEDSLNLSVAVALGAYAINCRTGNSDQVAISH